MINFADRRQEKRSSVCLPTLARILQKYIPIAPSVYAIAFAVPRLGVWSQAAGESRRCAATFAGHAEMAPETFEQSQRHRRSCPEAGRPANNTASRRSTTVGSNHSRDTVACAELGVLALSASRHHLVPRSELVADAHPFRAGASWCEDC
jgi:hypothetical protein